MIYIAISLLILITALVVVFTGGKIRKSKSDKILNILKQKNKITVSDVREQLGVADATATRYLDKLEREGKIKQVGEVGRHVFYIKR